MKNNKKNLKYIGILMIILLIILVCIYIREKTELQVHSDGKVLQVYSFTDLNLTDDEMFMKSFESIENEVYHGVIGEKMMLSFAGEFPDCMVIQEFFLNSDTGRPLYGNKEIKNISFTLMNKEVMFEIERSAIPLLSSNPPEVDLRGYKVTANVDEKSCIYIFFVETDSVLRK